MLDLPSKTARMRIYYRSVVYTMYVLVAVFITTSSVGATPYKGVSFQEFQSLESCQLAAQETAKMFAETRGYQGKDAYSLKCVSK